MMTAEPKLPYLLIVGTSDAEFCQRVSEALTDGYRLHGSPVISFDPGKAALVSAQALVLDIAVDKGGALR